MMRPGMLAPVRYRGGMVAVLAQLVGAVLLVLAVGLLWSWPVALAVAGALLIVGGLVAEMNREPYPPGRGRGVS